MKGKKRWARQPRSSANAIDFENARSLYFIDERNREEKSERPTSRSFRKDVDASGVTPKRNIT
jgi:hypothetical protein